MGKEPKVQTNDYGVNVLVQTTKSDNRNYSVYNKVVTLEKVLNSDEILGLWRNRHDKSDEIELAKNWIKRQKGYATSNCADETINIKYQSIVKYQEKQS